MTITRYDVRGSTLVMHLAGGGVRHVLLDSDIASVLQLPDMLVVLTSSRPGQIDNANVLAVSDDGQIRWRIAARAPASEDSPFTGIGLVGDDLRAYNWDGYEVRVDPATGQVRNEYWRK